MKNSRTVIYILIVSIFIMVMCGWYYYHTKFILKPYQSHINNGKIKYDAARHEFNLLIANDLCKQAIEEYSYSIALIPGEPAAEQYFVEAQNCLRAFSYCIQADSVQITSGTDQAIVLYEKADQLCPNLPMVHLEWGRRLARTGHSGKGVVHFEKAIQIDENFGPALHALGLEYIELVRYKEAAQLFRRAIKSNFEPGNTYLDLGRCERFLNNFPEALESFRKATEVNPRSHLAWNYLGMEYYFTKQYHEASICLQKACDLNPNNESSWAFWSLSLLKEKKVDEAITRIRSGIISNPDSFLLLERLAGIYFNIGRRQEAEAVYDEMIIRHPNESKGWLNKGMKEFVDERYDDALTHLEKALSLNPKDNACRTTIGTIMEKRKIFEESENYYIQIIKHDPNINFEAETNLAYCYLDYGMHSNAFVHFSIALQLNPNDPQTICNVGQALQGLKKYSKAEEKYLLALTIEPRFAKAWFY